MTTTMPAMVEGWAALLSDGGAAPADVAALEDLLQRISTLATRSPRSPNSTSTPSSSVPTQS